MKDYIDMGEFDSILSNIESSAIDSLEGLIVTDLMPTLEAITPVDTGALRSVYTVEKTKDEIIVRNSMKYAYIILVEGRHQVGSRWYGSEQLPDGVLPTIRQWKSSLEG